MAEITLVYLFSIIRFLTHQKRPYSVFMGKTAKDTHRPAEQPVGYPSGHPVAHMAWNPAELAAERLPEPAQSNHDNPLTPTRVGARCGNARNFAGHPVPLILGSASPARKTLLQTAGIEPLVMVSQVDEEQVLADLWARQEQPADLHEVARIQVSTLAQAKAESACTKVLQALDSGSLTLEASTLVIVACDSMLEIGGEVAGKPRTPQIARERWQRMSGQQGVLWTGHALIRLDQQTASTFHAAPPVVGAQSTVVHFGELTPTEIAAYVATGEPLKVAGAFTLDGISGPFIEGVQGDPHSVVGLSLSLLRQLLHQVGLSIPQLWNTPASLPGNPSTLTHFEHS